MRYSATGRTATTTPDSTKGPSLNYSTAGGVLREVGIFNTTTIAFCIGLQRITALGSGTSDITEERHDPNSLATPNLIAKTIGSGGHTTAGSPLYRATIGAAAGAGVVWTFGASGLVIPATSGAGLALIIPTGTGQHFDYYWVWDD